MTIRELKIIVDLVNTYKAAFVGSLEQFFTDKNEPKLGLFYKLLKEDKIKTDDDAAFLLVNATPFAETYQKLKHQFSDRVINLVFYVDNKKANKTFLGRTTVRTAKNVAAARILINHGEENAAISLLEETFEKTSSLERTDWNFMMLHQLVAYSAYHNKPDNFEKYSAELVTSYEVYKYELYSEIYMHELTLAFVRSESEKYKYRAKAEKYYRQITKWNEKVNSYILFFNKIEVGIYLGYIKKDYQLIIALANERDDFMRRKPQFKNYQYNAKNAIVRMEAYLYLREYELGKQEAKECINLFMPGTINWLGFLEYYFLLCMHMKNYAQALNIYYQVLKHPCFPELNKEYQERWKYFEPYLNYISPDQFLKENFDMLSFLDEISYYTEHKSDNNIVIMIGQIIIMIDVGELQKLKDRTQYLDNYIKKYVNKKIYPRTEIFLCLLVKLFRNKFNPHQTKQQTKKQFHTLRADMDNPLRETEPLEIIPYDQLWISLLEKLKSRLPEQTEKK